MDTRAPVSLIIPPSPFLLDERVFMTLGLLRVAAVLEDAGTPVEVLDLSGVENFEEAARDHARTTRAWAFGVTSTTPQLPAVARIQAVLRRVRPGARLVLGGPHITLVNAAARGELARERPGRGCRALDHLRALFDVLVSGDGEKSIFRALAPGAPGLVDADDSRSPLFLDSRALTELPRPARHLVDVDSYHYSIEGTPALSLIAQLGCPCAAG